MNKSCIKKTLGTCLAFVLALILLMMCLQKAYAASGSGKAGISFTQSYREVTFKLNYGSDRTYAQLDVIGGRSILTTPDIEMPRAPYIDEDNIFMGWNTRPNGSGEIFKGDTIVYENIIVFAQWIPAQPAVTVPPAVIPPVQVTPTPPLTPPPIILPPVSPPQIIVQTPPQIIIQAPPQIIIQTPPQIVQQAPIMPAPPAPEPMVIESTTEQVETELQDGLTPTSGYVDLPGKYSESETDEHKIILNTDVPLNNPGSRGLIIFASWGENAWALMNLLLAFTGGLIALITMARSLREKRREDMEAEIIQLINKAEDIYDPEEEKLSRRRRLHFLAAAGILGFAGVLLFLLTQDMNKRIALMDWWTFSHIIIMLLEIFAIMMIKKREKTEIKDEILS